MPCLYLVQVQYQGHHLMGHEVYPPCDAHTGMWYNNTGWSCKGMLITCVVRRNHSGLCRLYIWQQPRLQGEMLDGVEYFSNIRQ